jgi:hypothetical protein
MSRIVIAISLLAIGTATHADECFCLIHPSSLAILRGCEAKEALFFCTDPFSCKKSVQKINPDWKRVEAGTDPCSVCSGPLRCDDDRQEGVRGDHDAEKQQQ